MGMWLSWILDDHDGHFLFEGRSKRCLAEAQTKQSLGLFDVFLFVSPENDTFLQRVAWLFKVIVVVHTLIQFGFKTYSFSAQRFFCTIAKPVNLSRCRNTWPPRDSKFPLIWWVLLWCTSPTTLDFESSNCLEAWFVCWVPGCWWEWNLS